MPSLFQRRHYEWLAAFAARRYEECKTADQRRTIETWTQQLATALQADNSTFKRDLFIRRVAQHITPANLTT